MKNISLAAVILLATLSASTISSVAYAETSCGCGSNCTQQDHTGEDQAASSSEAEKNKTE